MAKVLMLSYLPLFPTNSGGRVRIRQLATQISRSHDVTVACPPSDAGPDRPLPFKLRETGVRGMRQLLDPRAYASVMGSLHEERPDIVLLEYIWQGLHVALARAFSPVPLWLDAFDVATVRFKSTGSRFWRLVSAYERFVIRRAQRVLAVSDIDRQHLIGLGAAPESTHVVPNGVDTNVFRPDKEAGAKVREALGLEDSELMILFVGSLDYAPNADAVQTLERELAPRLNGDRVFVAGKDPGGRVRQMHDGGRLHFLGSVDPIQDYLNAADVVVVPLRHGSGTRLKILESLACGVPTVTTSVGAEGLDLDVCGSGLVVVDEWVAFADATRQLASNGRSRPPAGFVETYDWRHIVERIRL